MVTKTGLTICEVGPCYYQKQNPYVNVPSCHMNLLELSLYAKQNGKKLAELTREEVNWDPRVL